MTTIILVSIGVLLAALSALMVMYYGANTLKPAEIEAQSSTIIGHLSMIQSAVSLYDVDEGSFAQPGSISYLVPSYLHMMPQNPLGPSWYYDGRMRDGSQPAHAAGGLDLVVAGAPMDTQGAAVCKRIAMRAGILTAGGKPPVVTSAATLPNAAIGCFEAEGWGGLSGIYVTYARIT